MSLLHGHICGCYYTTPAPNQWSSPIRHYLPQVDIKAHATILSTVSKTTLTQKFVVPSKTHGVRKLQYTFPLFDGVSVVAFKCTVGERIIVGEVQEKEQAKKTYEDAIDRGETAGLLEELPEASDVFVTSIGNVPPDSVVLVDITYLGELKHDAEIDGVRFTIPTTVAPRYGDYPGALASGESTIFSGAKFEATVDISLGDEAAIKELRSPSHPIAVSLGSISTEADAKPSLNRASATLSLGTAEISKDFVVQIISREFGTPTAIIEQNPTIPGSRALLTTLVPKFQLPQQRPEIVFICDRSGSMSGNRIIALRNALQTFIKSLPVGIVFNICSFGSTYSYLWPRSKPYNKENMEEAIKHVKSFGADYGGTEMFQPVKATLDQRFSDRSLEVFLVTDGEIWDQQTLFDLLNTRIQEKREPVRVFTLGVGDDVSHALIEGVARAGDGFCQTVGENEKLDAKVVRMLKAALIPHVKDYRLELIYEQDGSEDFELVERVGSVYKDDVKGSSTKSQVVKKVISLFDTKVDNDGPIIGTGDSIPRVSVPSYLQAPQRIPQLYPFNRTSIYILISLQAPARTLKAVKLRGTCEAGDLELDIPITALAEPGLVIHQLAAKKAVLELEEGRGWLQQATTEAGQLVKDRYPSHFDEIVRLETVRLGTTFQVGGKNCSFVAVEKLPSKRKDSTDDQAYDFLDDAESDTTISDGAPDMFRRSKGAEMKKKGTKFGLQMPGSAKASVASFGNGLGSTGFALRGGVGGGGPLFGMAPASASRSSIRMRSAQQQQQQMQQQQAAFAPSFASAAASPFPSAISSPFGASKPAAPPLHPQSTGLFGNTMPAPGGAPNLFRASLKSAARPSFGAVSPPPPAPAPAPVAAPAQSLFSAPTFADMDDGGMEFSAESTVEPMSSEEAVTHFQNEFLAERKEIAFSDDALQVLVDLQTFEGSWEWSNELFAIVGVDIASTEHAVNSLAIAADRTVFATALVVSFLESRLAADKDSWELIVDKAKGWLAYRLGAGELQQLSERAQSLLP